LFLFSLIRPLIVLYLLISLMVIHRRNYMYCLGLLKAYR
jgi:hypothetical protein